MYLHYSLLKGKTYLLTYYGLVVSMWLLCIDSASRPMQQVWWQECIMRACEGSACSSQDQASVHSLRALLREQRRAPGPWARSHWGKAGDLRDLLPSIPAPLQSAETHDETHRTTSTCMHPVPTSILRQTQLDGSHAQTHWRQSISLHNLWQTFLHQERPPGLPATSVSVYRALVVGSV